MRGIPRQAAAAHTPILGSDKTADRIANQYTPNRILSDSLP